LQAKIEMSIDICNGLQVDRICQYNEARICPVF
jgi:hypothetical protein